MVEKSRKTPICDAKSGKYGGFLGEGLSETKRETTIIKDLRAAHPPPPLRQMLDDAHA
jgi:hypothetical protein